MNVAAGFGFYLYITLYAVLDFFGKSGSLGLMSRAVIPTGNFLIIDLDP